MRKLMPLITLVAAAALIIFLLSMGGGFGFGTKAEPLTLTFPETWQGYTQVTETNGADALKLFQKEHVKKIPFRQGMRVDYTKGSDNIRVWVAAGSDEGNAATMLVLMSNAIGIANKTFSEPKPTTVHGVTMYRLTGQGATNYFYNKGRNVYFIAMTAPDADTLIEQVYLDF